MQRSRHYDRIDMSLPPLPPQLEMDSRQRGLPTLPQSNHPHLNLYRESATHHHPQRHAEQAHGSSFHQKKQFQEAQQDRSSVFRRVDPPVVNSQAVPASQEAIGAISAKKIIDDINHAATRSQRVLALQTACHAFSHSNQELHNYEVDLGGLNALVVKLGYCLLLRESSHVDSYEEIALLTRALHHLWSGCSLDRRVGAFQSLGARELLPLIVQVFRGASQSQHRSAAIYETLRILRVLAKLDPVKSALAQCTALIQALVKLLWSLENLQDIDVWQRMNGALSEDQLKLEILGVWKDLTFRMNDEDKHVLFETEGWLMPLCHVGRDSLTASSKVREYVSSILWNLALSPSVSVSMASDASLLSLLQYFIADEDATAKTRRSAVSAIGNMATLTDNQEKLVHQEGLLEALQRGAKSDDADCRRRAMRTLRCMIGGDAAQAWRQRASLIHFCANVAGHDVDSATRIQACECLGHVASDWQAVELVGDIVTLALMETMERSASDLKVAMAALRALSLCTSRQSELTLAAIKLTPTFLASLENVTNQSRDTNAHSSVGRFLASLYAESKCQDKLTSSPVLNILASLLLAVGPDFEDSRTDALLVIKGLAEQESYRRPMAEHDALLGALVNFALIEADGAKKDEAKGLILLLVPEL